MRSIRTCLLATALVALTACGDLPVANPPACPPTERMVVLDGTPMHPCGPFGTAVCGRLGVPEDRREPLGRRIWLKVMVIPASDPSPEPDPVFFLAGGPGGAATQIWSNAADIFRGVHAHRDIVLVDQRGTGRSHPVLLPRLPETTGMSPRRSRRAMTASIEHALATLEADPTLYGSAQAADDLDDVRAALGYRTIDLYGGSYGATLAQYYLRRHERHVRAMVLDGGSLLDVPVFERLARNSQRALESVFERCAADPSCRAAFPDPAGDLAAAMARLTDHPVEAPGADTPVVVDAEALANQIHRLLASSDAAEIPLLIHEAAAGRLGSIADRMLGQAIDPNASTTRLMMFWAIVCSEAWARFDPVRTAEVGAGSYLVDPQVEKARGVASVCRAMPDASPAARGDPFRSGVPVLLLHGAEDPQDPPSNVTHAAAELPNSLVVIVPALGHTVGHLDCLPEVVATFLDAGSTDGLDTSCVRAMTPPPFVTA